MSVCGSVCLSVREDISGTTHAIPNCLCMLPMSVDRSSFNMFTIDRIAYCREGVFFPIENALSAGIGEWSAQRGRIKYAYDCLVGLFYMQIMLLQNWVHGQSPINRVSESPRN